MSFVHQRPQEKAELTPSTEHKKPGFTFPTEVKELLVCYFFFFMQKSNQENRSEFQPTQKHRRKHQRACKVSPVFELFKERLLPPRGGTISCTTGPIRRGRVLLASGEPGDGVSASEPLTHTVFFIPVELVCRVALALVAAHRVHTDLLAASIVDTALVGVCGTKHAPVTAAHY